VSLVSSDLVYQRGEWGELAWKWKMPEKGGVGGGFSGGMTGGVRRVREASRFAERGVILQAGMMATSREPSPTMPLMANHPLRNRNRPNRRFAAILAGLIESGLPSKHALSTRIFNRMKRIDEDKEHTEARTRNWQVLLLPWMLAALIFTLVTSPLVAYLFLRLSYSVASTREAKTDSDITKNLAERLQASDAYLDAFDLEKRILLEKALIDQHYEQARQSQALRIWTRYLSFSTGMSLCLVGAFFVLGKLTDEKPTEVHASFPQTIKWSFASASSGTVLIAFGTAIIVTGLLRPDTPIEVKDQAHFLAIPIGAPRSEPTSQPVPSPQALSGDQLKPKQ
jgi:hypothetical protein